MNRHFRGLLSVHEFFHKDAGGRCIRDNKIVGRHIKNVIICRDYIHRVNVAENCHVLDNSNRIEGRGCIANCYLYNVISVRCKALDNLKNIHTHNKTPIRAFSTFLFPLIFGVWLYYTTTFFVCQAFFLHSTFCTKRRIGFYASLPTTPKSPYISTFLSSLYI